MYYMKKELFLNCYNFENEIKYILKLKVDFAWKLLNLEKILLPVLQRHKNF